jgi:hypothetical protein
MVKKFQGELEGQHGAAVAEGPVPARTVLEEAHAFAVQIERLLTGPQCDFAEADTFRVRLARAHTLSLLDQLSELIGSRDSAREPRRSTHDGDEGTASGVRTAWR